MENLKLSDTTMRELQQIMYELEGLHSTIELQRPNIIESSSDHCRGCGGGCEDSCRGTCGYACSNSFLP